MKCLLNRCVGCSVGVLKQTQRQMISHNILHGLAVGVGGCMPQHDTWNACDVRPHCDTPGDTDETQSEVTLGEPQTTRATRLGVQFL